jgi:signal transduction histidine kinase
MTPTTERDVIEKGHDHALAKQMVFTALAMFVLFLIGFGWLERDNHRDDQQLRQLNVAQQLVDTIIITYSEFVDITERALRYDDNITTEIDAVYKKIAGDLETLSRMSHGTDFAGEVSALKLRFGLVVPAIKDLIATRQTIGRRGKNAGMFGAIERTAAELTARLDERNLSSLSRALSELRSYENGLLGAGPERLDEIEAAERSFLSALARMPLSQRNDIQSEFKSYIDALKATHKAAIEYQAKEVVSITEINNFRQTAKVMKEKIDRLERGRYEQSRNQRKLKGIIAITLALFSFGIIILLAARVRKAILTREEAVLQRQHELRQEHKRIESLSNQLLKAKHRDGLASLAAGIAHDFNNIIASQRMSAQLLATELQANDKNARTTSHIKRIVSACDRGTQMVRQITSFARSANDDRMLLNIDETMHEVIAMIESIAPGNVMISYTESNGALKVEGNPTSLSRALINLGKNAIDAMGDKPDGKLKIEVKNEILPQESAALMNDEADNFIKQSSEDFGVCRRVYGRFTANQRYAKITFEDNGCGFSRSALNNIFKPFFTTKKATGGTGLGLTIIAATIHAINGIIVLTTEENMFSRFEIYLPLVSEPSAGQNDISANHAATA